MPTPSGQRLVQNEKVTAKHVQDWLVECVTVPQVAEVTRTIRLAQFLTSADLLRRIWDLIERFYSYLWFGVYLRLGPLTQAALDGMVSKLNCLFVSFMLNRS